MNRFDPSWFNKTHTLVSGIDLGMRSDPTAIVTALAMPGHASIISVRHGVWTMHEIQQMTAGTVVGCDVNGELLGGHTLSMHRTRYGIEDMAVRVAFGLWSFPAARDVGVQQLLNDAMAWKGHGPRSWVLYNDTGWAHPDWAERVERGEAFARGLGMQPARTHSPGFIPIARVKQAFPRSGMQFCTTMLKIEPSLAWLDANDPDGDLIGVVGVRREESARRQAWPEWVEDSALDGGRSLWAPLVRYTEAQRDDLLRRAGFEPLPHRSDECFPCVNGARSDLRRLADAPDRIREIEDLEAELSVGKKPRRMFRRQSGIRETIAWAQSAPGQYAEGQEFLFGCDAGYCGM